MGVVSRVGGTLDPDDGRILEPVGQRLGPDPER
jgi:hypothetical protein